MTESAELPFRSPYAGLRLRKAAEWSFRQLRENGDEGLFMCPLNTAKDPRNPHAW